MIVAIAIQHDFAYDLCATGTFFNNTWKRLVHDSHCSIGSQVFAESLQQL